MFDVEVKIKKPMFVLSKVLITIAICSDCLSEEELMDCKLFVQTFLLSLKRKDRLKFIK